MAKKRPPTSNQHFKPSRFAVASPNDRAEETPRWITIPPTRGDGSIDLGDIITAQAVRDIQDYGSISFHAVGDTGRGANTEQQDVAEAMVRDVDRSHHAASPAFLCHLGDIIYGPDKDAHYLEKFYRPYADYPNSILAIPGNHDGDVDKLASYLNNFCQSNGAQPPNAVALHRIMPNQPVHIGG